MVSAPTCSAPRVHRLRGGCRARPCRQNSAVIVTMCESLRPVRTAKKSCPATPPWANSRGSQASSPPGEEVVLCTADACSNGAPAGRTKQRHGGSTLTSEEQRASGATESSVSASFLLTNARAGNASVCQQRTAETSSRPTSTTAAPTAAQAQNNTGLSAGSGGPGAPAAAAEGDRREAKEVLSRLLVSKQKELLRLQLQAKAQQLAQLRGRLHDTTPVQAGKGAGVPPPTPASTAGSAPVVPAAPACQVGPSEKTNLQKQEERIKEQRDRLAA